MKKKRYTKPDSIMVSIGYPQAIADDGPTIIQTGSTHLVTESGEINAKGSNLTFYDDEDDTAETIEGLLWHRNYSPWD